MHIVLFGATGLTGSHVLTELLQAGYKVNAVVRNPAAVTATHQNLTVTAGDVLQPESLPHLLAGADAVVSTISEGVQIVHHTQSRGNGNIIEAMEKMGLQRFICMGAIGILDGPDGRLIRDNENYPKQYLPLSLEHSRVQELLQASTLQWTQVCPPDILPHAANGKYAVKANVPANGSGSVNAGNIGHFIAKEAKENAFLRVRVGICNV